MHVQWLKRGIFATPAPCGTTPHRRQNRGTDDGVRLVGSMHRCVRTSTSTMRRSGSSATYARPTLRLLARGVDGDLGAAARRGASLGPADGPHLAAPSSSAEELIAAIGLEP